MHHDYVSEDHKISRSQWLRAAVLGANDGIVSVSSVIIGVAAAGTNSKGILVAGFAATVAGALSMAAGEYVSVSSQRDVEKADLELEKKELELYPDQELAELQRIYIKRGLTPTLAKKVASAMHDHDALSAHAREELGINTDDLTSPWLAAVASGIAFTLGALLPLIAGVITTGSNSSNPVIVAVTLIALAVLGAVGAHLGGASQLRGSARVLIGGSAAMILTYIIGLLVGTHL
ncbi:MAG: VIT family protein [Patescibacteria group bacterium]